MDVLPISMSHRDLNRFTGIGLPATSHRNSVVDNDVVLLRVCFAGEKLAARHIVSRAAAALILVPALDFYFALDKFNPGGLYHHGYWISRPGPPVFSKPMINLSR